MSKLGKAEPAESRQGVVRVERIDKVVFGSEVKQLLFLLKGDDNLRHAVDSSLRARTLPHGLTGQGANVVVRLLALLGQEFSLHVV